MRAKIGILCILLGIGLMAGSLALYLNNETEAIQADQAAQEMLPLVVEEIRRAEEEETRPPEFFYPTSVEMTEKEIDGHSYIGVLTIPILELELPVMADWSYPKLKIAPCRYTGTVRGEDLVLMAHNYKRHFGRLSDLTVGDLLIFTDMDGVGTEYRVVGKDILPPTAVEEMTSGDYDLTLFTCTYGGQSRVTVYCDRTDE